MKTQECINASCGQGSRGRGRGSRGHGCGRGSRGRGQGSRGQGGDRGTFQGQCHSQDLLNSDDSSDTDADGKAVVISSSTSSSADCEEPGGETSTSSDECNCVVCDTHDDGRWIQCDVCDSWCHFKMQIFLTIYLLKAQTGNVPNVYDELNYMHSECVTYIELNYTVIVIFVYIELFCTNKSGIH